MDAAVKALFFTGFLALAGCDREDPTPRPVEVAPRARVATALGLDAADLEPSVDPPAPAGDLEGEIAAFTTVDTCVAQRAAGDPLLGDALEAIGYDTLIRDACRSLDAAKSRDVSRCADILASTLKSRCEARVAELAGDPDACPFDISSRPELGRDAACLALASHDGRLCAGALDPTARVTCEAIASRDVAPCKTLSLRTEQGRCARDEQRWGAVLTAAHSSPEGPALSTGGTLQQEPAATGSATQGQLDVPRGVVLVERSDGTHFVVGAMNDGGQAFLASSPLTAPRLAFEVVVPQDLGTSSDCADGTHRPICLAWIARSQFTQPGHATTTLSDSKAKALLLKVTKLEKKRGGRIELGLVGAVGEGPVWSAVVGTFVRDIVTARASFGISRFGDDGGMR
jgi:hypothetical protein